MPVADDPVKLTTPTRWSCDERRADIGAEALHGAVDADRQARVLQQLAELDRGVRRQLVRLHDDRVAAQQRRKHFPRDAGERAVERHDRRADADRAAAASARCGSESGSAASCRRSRLPSPSMKIARSADDATSATAFFHGLPVSAWTISPNSFSRSRSSCAARPRIAPRFGTGVRAPLVRRARGRRQRVRHFRGAAARHLRDHLIVAGLRFSNVVLSFGATSTSAIQCGTNCGYSHC